LVVFFDAAINVIDIVVLQGSAWRYDCSPALEGEDLMQHV
jgi:hypothetical protein